MNIPDIRGDCGQQRPFLGGDLNGLGMSHADFWGNIQWVKIENPGALEEKQRPVRLEWREYGAECEQS